MTWSPHMPEMAKWGDFSNKRHKELIMLKIVAIAALSASLLGLTACGSPPPGPKYQNIRSFSEGLAAVQAANGRWGFINEQQQWVIQPHYEEAKEFQAGKAPAKKSGKWGFINKRGEWL